MITVISQNTAERQEETRELFNNIRPYLDNGYNYTSALKKIGKISSKHRVYQTSWFRDLKEYGETQGYPYHKYMGRGFK